MTKTSIAFVGAGEYAEALGREIATANPNSDVRLFTHRSDYKENGHWRHLKNSSKPANVRISANARECIDDADIVFISTKTAHLVELLCGKVADTAIRNKPLVSLCKGVHGPEHALPLEAIASCLEIEDGNLAAASGPGFAQDIADEKEATIVVAGTESITSQVCDFLGKRNVTILQSRDRIGVQCCGIKNTLAIGLGMQEELSGGLNEKWELLFEHAAQEMNAFVVSQGGLSETAKSPAGIGDLRLTSSVGNSRNRHYGKGLVRGMFDTNNQTVEGHDSAEGYAARARSAELELPLLYLVHVCIKNKRVCSKEELAAVLRK